MVELGKHHELMIVKELPFGDYLEANGNEILLPIKDVPAGAKPGDVIRVFIYKDSDARPIATTKEPLITLDGFASLEVKDVNKFGAFLDWGIENQLLLPFREQVGLVAKGVRCIVRLYLDRVSDRLAATMKVEKFLEKNADDLIHEGDEVDLLVYEETGLGYKAIVNGRFSGIIYRTDIFSKVGTGDSIRGFIAKIREDRKIDLTLRRSGIDELAICAEKIIYELKNAGGFLPINDSSEPEDIQKALQMSKKSFKRAIGMLYKDKKLNITENGIRIIKKAK